MSPGERVFVDTGGWIALAETKDPLHLRARAQWETMGRSGSKIFTSIPVVLETFTFLDRKGSRELALRWKESLAAVPRFKVLGCTPDDLSAAWRFFDRKDLHKLSLVDATSFALMQRHQIRRALAFDVHFSIAGFSYVA